MTGLREVIIIGGGLAGCLWPCIRSEQAGQAPDPTQVDRWPREANVQNYLGFPAGIAGTDLLDRGMAQAVRLEVQVAEDEVLSVMTNGETFHISGRQGFYDAKRVLLRLRPVHRYGAYRASSADRMTTVTH